MQDKKMTDEAIKSFEQKTAQASEAGKKMLSAILEQHSKNCAEYGDRIAVVGMGNALCVALGGILGSAAPHYRFALWLEFASEIMGRCGECDAHDLAKEMIEKARESASKL